jgi:sugar O-acyltransferase (sialic acid O-acetyltransferase NeuD family)
VGNLKKELIIFGTGKIAEAISYYFNRDGEYAIVAYVIDDNYKIADTFLGKPVVVLSKVFEKFPPQNFTIFVAVGYQGLNTLRESKYNYFKNKGYNFATYKSPAVAGDYVIGENSIIMDGVVVQPKVTIDDNVIIWGGAMLGHHATIMNHCWLTGGCLIGGSVIIGEKTFVGIGVIITQEIKVGESCVLGASTFITKDVEDNSVLISPATEKFRLNSKQFVKMSSLFKS